MHYKRRYKFWHILVGLFACGMLYMLITALSHTVIPAETTNKVVTKPVKHTYRSFVLPLYMFLYMAVFFYYTLNYFYTYIADNKKWYAFIKLVLVIILVVGAWHSLLYFYYPDLLRKNYGSLGQMWVIMLNNMIPMLIMPFLFAFGTYLWESQKQRRILEAQKLQLEAQISQANLNFLKAQINPHFLHNTLNFLYAKSLPYSAELSEGILTLSDIMRYALDQGNQREGKAPLKDEVEHVHNVIKISQLRYSDQLKVNFKVEGDLEDKKIIPFVLITLVENAFKHGDLKSMEHPIDIGLTVKNGRLRFYCKNKKKTGPTQISTGIGIDNIRKRLDLAYGNKYRFIVKEDDQFYSTELTIDEL